jgi:hypothetical protein
MTSIEATWELSFQGMIYLPNDLPVRQARTWSPYTTLRLLNAVEWLTAHNGIKGRAYFFVSRFSTPLRNHARFRLAIGTNEQLSCSELTGIRT